MPDIKLIAGLGNPGNEYAETRHNIGFMALDVLAGKYSADWKSWGGHSEISNCNIGRTVILVKPQTFMNRSGLSIKNIADYYHILPSEILALIDDFALPLGKLRLRLSGSAGGHNGLLSMIEHLGTTEFPRLRFGIGPIPPRIDPAEFVLGKFLKEEKEAVRNMIAAGVEAVDNVINLGAEKAASKLSAKNGTEKNDNNGK